MHALSTKLFEWRVIQLRTKSEMDIADLKNHVAQGASLAKTSEFLCRNDEFEIARKNKELGLRWQRSGHKRKPKPTWPFDRTPR